MVKLKQNGGINLLFPITDVLDHTNNDWTKQTAASHHICRFNCRKDSNLLIFIPQMQNTETDSLLVNSSLSAMFFCLLSDLTWFQDKQKETIHPSEHWHCGLIASFTISDPLKTQSLKWSTLFPNIHGHTYLQAHVNGTGTQVHRCTNTCFDYLLTEMLSASLTMGSCSFTVGTVWWWACSVTAVVGVSSSALLQDYSPATVLCCHPVVKLQRCSQETQLLSCNWLDSRGLA